MKKLFLFIIITITATACSNMQVRQSLDDVESYIMERPDSALIVLDTMNRQCLTTKRLRAHHALLHAMALDKNYIDVTDDSLARVALTYFSKHGPQKYEARSLYYLALSYYYAGDYSKAILEFTKAEKVAESSDSLYWGMSNGMLGTIYSKSHNDKEASKYIHHALDIYSDINAQYYIDVTMFKLAKSYFNADMLFEADSILQSMINRSDIVPDLRMAILTDYAFIQAIQPNSDYRLSSEIYESVIAGGDDSVMTSKDYWVYSYLLSILGRTDEANNLILQLKDIDSSSTADYWQYRINRERGNVYDALSFLESSVSKNNVEITNVLKQSLASVQKDYYESQFRETLLKVKVKNQTICMIIIVSFLVLLMVMYFVRRRLAISKAEKEMLLGYIDEVKRQLDQSKSEDYPLLKKRFISLYKSRFEAIGQLCEQYLENKERDDIESVMYRKMLLMIEDIRNDAVRRDKFETLLDAELENIMTRFRNEMPKCKETDVTLFSYLVVGFDATTISRLMNLSLNNIYAQKRRLRIKIEEKKPEHMHQFLEMIA